MNARTAFHAVSLLALESSDEIGVYESLGVIAHEMGLETEATSALNTILAMRASDQAQLDFRVFLEEVTE